MKNNIFNRVIFGIVLAIIVCFSCINQVNAMFNFEIEKTTNLYSHCNLNNKCYPICVYGNNEAFIGYYYDTDDSASNTAWEIGFKYDYSKKSSAGQGSHVVGESLLYWKDTYLLKTNVYPGASDKDWSNAEMYNNVINKFQCPDFMYIDESNQNELCFADEMGKCEKHNDWWNVTVSFKEPLKLTYGINDEINAVNGTLYSERNFDNVSIYKVDSKTAKTQFLFNFDNEISYNESLTNEENIKNNCKYFSDKINNDGGKIYIQNLIAGDYVKNYIADLDKGYSDVVSKRSSVVKNPELFTYDMQKTLLIYGDKKYRNEYFEKVDKLLEDSIVESIKYASSVCDGTEYKVNLDEEGSRSAVAEKYSLYKFKDPEIRFDDEFKCSDIFTEEMVDIIKTAYFIIEMVGLAILVVFSALDYIKVFMSDNADELKKANSNLIKRLIILVILFLLPALVNVILRLFKIDYVEGIDSEYRLCVHVSNK